MNDRRDRLTDASARASILFDTFSVSTISIRTPYTSSGTHKARAEAVKSISALHKTLYGKGISRTHTTQGMLKTIDAWVKGKTDADIDDTTLVYSLLDILRLQANGNAQFSAECRRGIGTGDALRDSVSLDTGDYAGDVYLCNANWVCNEWARQCETREHMREPLDILIGYEESDTWDA